MVDQLLLALTIVAALGCGLMAGVFFAFSAFVMQALARLAPAAGIAAMQAINIAVINPLFLAVFLGTAVLCLALALVAPWLAPTADLPYLLAGGTAYVAGTFLVTVLGNVPLNDQLARADPTSPQAAALWQRYLARWTAWNHVRTAAAAAAMALLMLALR